MTVSAGDGLVGDGLVGNDASSAGLAAAQLTRAVQKAIVTELTPHQRRVVLALLVEGVPIDVLADRLGSSRNALYKALHDARQRLRQALEAGGHLDTSSTRSTS